MSCMPWKTNEVVRHLGFYNDLKDYHVSHDNTVTVFKRQFRKLDIIPIFCECNVIKILTCFFHVSLKLTTIFLFTIQVHLIE